MKKDNNTEKVEVHSKCQPEQQEEKGTVNSSAENTVWSLWRDFTET